MDLASLVVVSVVTVACSMLSLLLVNENMGFVTQRIPEFERYKGLFIYRL